MRVFVSVLACCGTFVDLPAIRHGDEDRREGNGSNREKLKQKAQKEGKTALWGDRTTVGLVWKDNGSIAQCKADYGGGGGGGGATV